MIGIAQFLAALGLAAASTAFAAASPPVAALQGRAMGTTYSAKFWRPEGEPNSPEIQAAIDALLVRFDLQMSTYRPDSELSRFASAAPDEWFPVSRETAAATAHALDVHRLTRGASDVTIGPVLRLWRFGPGGAPNRGRAASPAAAELENAMQLVGAEKLQVRLDPPALKKLAAGVEVDLSSMAPGYAVDLIVELLIERGYENCLVELGGEVRAAGARPDGSPWRVGVESAPCGDKKFARVVPLHDLALATSGDYRDLRTIDGVRYTHVIDPRSGRPVPYRGACVSVLAPTCLEADALGAPLLVMGPDDGFQWCVEYGVAAIFQTCSDNQIDMRETPRFRELAEPSKAPTQGTAAE